LALGSPMGAAEYHVQSLVTPKRYKRAARPFPLSTEPCSEGSRLTISLSLLPKPLRKLSPVLRQVLHASDSRSYVLRVSIGRRYPREWTPFIDEGAFYTLYKQRAFVHPPWFFPPLPLPPMRALLPQSLKSQDVTPLFSHLVWMPGQLFFFILYIRPVQRRGIGPDF